MAKPIELMPKPSGQGAREELQRRLDAAPVEHAEAVLAGYELLQELHESGTLDVLRGLLGAGDQVVRHAVALAIQPEAVNGLRNLLVLSKVLGSVNPDVLHGYFPECPTHWLRRRRRTLRRSSHSSGACLRWRAAAL